MVGDFGDAAHGAGSTLWGCLIILYDNYFVGNRLEKL